MILFPSWLPIWIFSVPCQGHCSIKQQQQTPKLVINWWLWHPTLPVFIVNSVWRICTKGKVILPAVSNLPSSAPVWCSRKLDWIVQDTRFPMGSQRPKFGNPSRHIGLLCRKLWFPSRCQSLRTTSVQIPLSPFLPSRIWLLTFWLKGCDTTLLCSENAKGKQTICECSLKSRSWLIMLNVYAKKRRGVASASCSDSPVTKPDALDLVHPLLLLNLVHLFLINKKPQQDFVVV